MGPFCQVDAPPPRPVAGSEDEVLLTAPEIDCSSQIAVTEELSFAFSARETSPGLISEIKSSIGSSDSIVAPSGAQGVAISVRHGPELSRALD